ncbi:MAG TPA: iron ABC transporter permease [Chitinispirillaceae bacterium]|nr:iron ABC transporter permease [Chitinispirillaceae bacterium]
MSVDTTTSTQMLKYISSKNKKGLPAMLLLIGGLISLSILAIVSGRYHISLPDLFATLYSGIIHNGADVDSTLYLVIYKIRFPRILASILVGAALSASGTCYQTIFRNPMVEPSLLGVSFGASFGAAIAILFSFNIAMIQITAFSFGLLAVGVTLLLSSSVSKNGDNTLTLILCGIMTSALFSAFLSLTKYVADPDSKLPAITYWLMGSLASINMSDLKFAAIFFTAGIIPMFLLRWQINTMAFGEDEARTMGINTRLIKIIVIVSATMMTASAVSISGKVDWIGLLLPHLARLIVGPSFSVLLPVSVLLGALFLLLVDTFSRLTFSIEIPIGILTAIIGAPFFISLLFRAKRGWL